MYIAPMHFVLLHQVSLPTLPVIKTVLPALECHYVALLSVLKLSDQISSSVVALFLHFL